MQSKLYKCSLTETMEYHQFSRSFFPLIITSWNFLYLCDAFTRFVAAFIPPTPSAQRKALLHCITGVNCKSFRYFAQQHQKKKRKKKKRMEIEEKLKICELIQKTTTEDNFSPKKPLKMFDVFSE